MTRPPAPALTIIRDATWLTAIRARAYATMLALFLGVAAIWVANARFHETGPAKPEATDFAPFYAAGIMVREGHAAAAYQLDALTAVEARSANLKNGRLPFMYPPVLLILCGWLAALPEPAAYAIFELLGLVPLLFCLWRMLPRPASTVPLLTAPALLMNFGSGQTGFYAAAAFAGALILIADQPILAGICLGALVFKPHFALLVPFALAASGRWRSLFACASTAGSLCAVSWLVLPAATWPAFLAQAGTTRVVMEHASTSALLISVFGALHVAGVYLPLAYTGQATAAALCILLVVTAGRRTAWRGTASRPTASRPTASHPKASHPKASHNRDNGAGEIALIAAAALCVTPYAMDYDLTVTMVAAVWLVAEAHRTAWRPWEKLAVAAVALLPLFARATVIMTGFQPAPIVLGVFVCMVWRRAMAVPIT